MNNIYFDKYEKYKLKYLKLKKEYIGEGGLWPFDLKRRNELNSRLKQQESVASDLYNECKIIKYNYNKILQQKEKANIEKEEAYELVSMLNREIIIKNIIIKLIKVKEGLEYVQLKNETVMNLLKETKKQEAKEVMLIEELTVLKKEIEKIDKAQKEFTGFGNNKEQILKEILINERDKVLLQCLEAETKREDIDINEQDIKLKERQIKTLEQVHKQAVLIKILTRIQVMLQEQEILFQQTYKELLETYYKNNKEIEKILQIPLEQYIKENSINKDKLALAQEQYLIEQNKYIELEQELVLKKEEYNNKYNLYKEALRLKKITEKNIKEL